MGEATNLRINMLESELNKIISKKLCNSDFLIINELRLKPAEFDIIILNKITLQLINLEIKRNNWKKLLDQAIRGKLYCHYSIAVMPQKSKRNINLKYFEDNGIGVAFYNIYGAEVECTLELEPHLSNIINRDYKKLLYKKIIAHHKIDIYA